MSKRRIIFRDKTTGQPMESEEFFTAVLKTPGALNKEDYAHVHVLLEGAGLDYSADPKGRRFAYDSRQLRDAKEHLVATGELLIVSCSGGKGGYKLAASWEEVRADIDECEAKAEGCTRRARELRMFAETQFGPEPPKDE
jgi:hypothetical protein